VNEGLADAVAALHPASFAWALACCGRRASDATDVLQDAYEKVLSGAARFEGRSSLKTWLFGVIRLTAREHARKSTLRWLFPTRQQERAPPPSYRTPDQAAAGGELRSVITAALAELAPRQREVIHLVFYEELTIEEAAAVMAVSLGTARIHYDRGKKSLAAALARRGVTRAMIPDGGRTT
jgi:RNA polymerase sigma-70 factor (ECF subfamily)